MILERVGVFFEAEINVMIWVTYVQRKRYNRVYGGEFMKKSILMLIMCMCMLACFGCGKKTKKPTSGVEGQVTMSAELTGDESMTLECTIFNKTSKDIVTGEEYSLQVLQGKSFVDVPLITGAFNLVSIDILAGEEYGYRAYIEKNYGKLDAGHYRIVKEYTIKGDDSEQTNDDTKETVSAEFDLE